MPRRKKERLVNWRIIQYMNTVHTFRPKDGEGSE